MFENESGRHNLEIQQGQNGDEDIIEGPTPTPTPIPNVTNDNNALVSSGGPRKDNKQPSDIEMMKERFAKLLLGEDMSGGGKGVSSALALSNAITNLAASVFGEQSKLEPMKPTRKARWKKEIDWLLSVTDYIVELVPSEQKSKDGKSMEIMVTQQRKDLLMNIPALKKLDTMLIDCLDNCVDKNEFWYVSKDADESEKGVQKSDKWWLPTVKVPPNGLSEASRKWLQHQKDCVNQVLKASMAINAQILSEMMIPDSYIETLPKNGRSSLGDSIYKNITVDFFDPEQFLSTIDMSSEHKILDLKNKIEASIVIWKRKMNQKDAKSSWGSGVSMEKRELFEERAETIFLLLKHRFPGLPQSSLDISKIQFNRVSTYWENRRFDPSVMDKDVGHAVLESYSRVLESLANTVMSRIEDILYADSLTQNPPLDSAERNISPSTLTDSSSPPPSDDASIEETEKSSEPPTTLPNSSSMTLLDFMGWSDSVNSNDENDIAKPMTKPITTKKLSYVEKIESCLLSPTSRH